LGAAEAAALRRIVSSRLAPAVSFWFEEALAAAADPGSRAAYLAAWAGAGRRLGRAALEATAAERASLTAAGLQPVPDGWGLDEAGRAALLLAAAAPLAAEQERELVAELFYKAEVRERQALLRALAWLTHPENHVDVAVEACRSSVQGVFEAIACENAYPERHFGDGAFNQMVLKAVFLGVAVERIVGLARRATPELARMARDYASERRAAGRPVPADAERLAAGRP
jgi:hypothetical protein